MGQQTPTTSEQREHTVRKGDTLWDLARLYLNDAYRWPTIYEANRSVVENPHWIYPSEKLVIPGMVADALRTQPAVMLADAGTGAERTRFYTPTRIYDGPTLITTEASKIPLVQALEWLAAPWIGDAAKLDVTAKVLQAADPRVVSDKLTSFFHPRDKLFLSVSGKVQPGDQLLAVRFERKLKGLGWVIVPQGILRVDSLGTNTASATVLEQFADFRLGDAAIPLPAIPALPANSLTEVTGGPVSEVIEFLVDQPLYGTTDFAFVTRLTNAVLQRGIPVRVTKVVQ